MAMQNNRRAPAEGFEDEALRDVLSIERQVQGIVNDAEQEAQRTIHSAQERARELKQQVETEAQEQAAASSRESMARIEQEAADIRQRAEDDSAGWIRIAETHFEQAVSYVLNIVTLSETDDGNRP